MTDPNNPFNSPYSYYSPHSSYLPVNIPMWKHIRGNAEPVVYPIDANELKSKIIENLQLVYDPEIPVNVWDLGLIYAIHVSDHGDVRFLMTLTTPNCPSAQELPEVVQMAAMAVMGVKGVELDLTFDPPWEPKSMISEDGKLIMLAEYGMNL